MQKYNQLTNSSHNTKIFRTQENNKYFSFEKVAMKEKKTNEEKLNEKEIKNDDDSDKKLLK